MGEDVVQIVIAISVTIGAVVGVAALSYKIRQNRNEHRRNAKERQEKIRSALKVMYLELNDTKKDIEGDRKIHTYEESKNGEVVSFLKVRFFYTDCEDLIKSPEIRSTNLDVSEIKEAIAIIKAHNKIFDRLEQDLPTVKEGEDIPDVKDNTFPDMLKDCKMMRGYQKRLGEIIPPILQKIKDECDQWA